jgi:hypothetical protein
VRIIKYWLKVQSSDNILFKHVYDQDIKDCNDGCHNWVYNVKKLLAEYDFVNCFDNVHVLNTKSFPLVFKKKVIEMYKPEWYDTVNKSTAMDLYKFLT